MKASELATIFKGMHASISSKVTAELTRSAIAVRQELRQRAPVQSGEFREAWRIEPVKSIGGRVLRVSIYNTTIQAVAIEAGSKKGTSPWPSAKSPRTAEFAGRIWSSQAIGGTVTPMLSKSFVLNFSRRIANNVRNGIRA